ncbi:MAG: SIR2 family protein [Planctomycetia bacterium]|nr:SIR2 family protein [Planctomycetia bacterium]
MNWPNALICELAERRCAIFLGSGASAGSKGIGGVHPPDWKTFLEHLMAKMQTTSEQAIAESLIAEKRYLEAAEVIKSDVAIADFTQFIRDELVAPKFAASEIHKSVLQIDPKIVLTTNYDDIYDTYCRNGDAAAGYNVCKYYDSHLVSDLRSPIRLIVKAHGCISNPSKIVLTRSDYFEQRLEHERFFHVLDGLFVTSTLLFIGYSLSDPDIQLVLENANIAAPRAHPHYAVIPDDAHAALRKSWSKSYNIQFIDYPAGDYTLLNNKLIELTQSVNEYRKLHIS